MKKFLLVMLMLLTISMPKALMAVEVTIGNPASTTTQYTLHLNMYFNYSLTQQIYTADEIGMAGTIYSISFEYTNTSAFTMKPF